MGGIEGPTVESQAVGDFARVMRPGARLVVVLLFLGLVAAPPALAQQSGASDVHGFLEFSLKNTYLTPRGLVVHTPGVAVQPLAGLVFRLHSGGILDGLSLVTGVCVAVRYSDFKIGDR